MYINSVWTAFISLYSVSMYIRHCIYRLHCQQLESHAIDAICNTIVFSLAVLIKAIVLHSCSSSTCTINIKINSAYNNFTGRGPW